MIIVPSVAASDCRRRYATSQPLTSPTPSPIRHTSAKAAGTPKGSAVLTVATTTLVTAMTPAAERSISAASNTNVSPAAASASTTVLLSRLVSPNGVSAAG